MNLNLYGEFETPNQFYARVYIDFVRENAWVYSTKIGLGKSVLWTLEQAKQYAKHLKMQEDNKLLI